MLNYAIYVPSSRIIDGFKVGRSGYGQGCGSIMGVGGGAMGGAGGAGGDGGGDELTQQRVIICA